MPLDLIEAFYDGIVDKNNIGLRVFPSSDHFDLIDPSKESWRSVLLPHILETVESC